MQKKGERWYKAIVPMDLLSLTLIVQRVKPEVMLLLIFNNQKDMPTDYLKELSEKIRKRPSGFIDINLLYNEMNKLIIDKEYKKYLSICDKSFPDKKLK